MRAGGVTRVETDVLVSGAGVAGLTAAAAFAAAGSRVTLVDPAPPVTAEDAPDADLRTTAILQPGVAVLEAAGLWDRLAPHATALQVMRIVDAGGVVPEPRVVKDFDASDISDKPFGWNLPNWLLRREMVARLAELPGVDFRPGASTASVTAREAEAIVGLGDGTQVHARLLIADDPLRTEGGRLCRDPSDPPPERLDRDSSLWRAVHPCAPARPRWDALLGRCLDGNRPERGASAGAAA